MQSINETIVVDGQTYHGDNDTFQTTGAFCAFQLYNGARLENATVQSLVARGGWIEVYGDDCQIDNVSQVGTYWGIKLVNCRYPYIRNWSYDGDTRAASDRVYGILGGVVYGAFIENPTIQRASLSGIKLAGDAGLGYGDCKRISIGGGTISNGEKAGISGYAGSEDILVAGTQFLNNAGGGIDLKTGWLNDEWGTTCKNWRIQNVISDSNEYGLIVAVGSAQSTKRVHQIHVYNSQFNTNTVDGIFVSVGYQISLDGCTANNNTNIGLAVGANAASTVTWSSLTATGNGVANIQDNR